MSKLRRPENTCPPQNPQQAAAGNPGGVLFEVFERYLHILADLEDIAVGIAHVATPLCFLLSFMTVLYAGAGTATDF